jgi:hypothetical protein
MTLKRLKSAIKILLTGDVVLPRDDDVFLAGLEMAMCDLASKCTALKLLTPDIDEPIVRQGIGNMFIRMPKLPELETDEIDVDNDLVPAIANIMASYMGEKQMKPYYKQEADKIIFEYEKKVDRFLKTTKGTTMENANAK